MVKFVESPIDPALAYQSICTANSGSVVFHYAVVKKHAEAGKSTTAIEYIILEGAQLELENIANELKDQWNLQDVLILRRAGIVSVGEIISLVAASSPNSEDAFESCKCGISRLKKMSTVCKTEIFDTVTN
jgi:molybdopterin synthase catalytic subunit